MTVKKLAEWERGTHSVWTTISPYHKEKLEKQIIAAIEKTYGTKDVITIEADLKVSILKRTSEQ